VLYYFAHSAASVSCFNDSCQTKIISTSTQQPELRHIFRVDRIMGFDDQCAISFSIPRGRTLSWQPTFAGFSAWVSLVAQPGGLTLVNSFNVK